MANCLLLTCGDKFLYSQKNILGLEFLNINFALRDEKVNIHSLTEGFNDYHQIFLCKKSTLPEDRIGPFVLDVKASDPKYPLSDKGKTMQKWLSTRSHRHNHIAYIDSYIKFAVTKDVFVRLCSGGWFDIWEPQAPFQYFEGRDIGYLMVLRVYKIKEAVPECLLDRGKKGRHFYFQLSEQYMVTPENAVLSNDRFYNLKIGLITELQQANCFIGVVNNKYNVPICVKYDESFLTEIQKEAEEINSSLSLKEVAEKIRNKGLRKIEITVTTKSFYRDPDVGIYAKKRANGICECCELKAPFIKQDGTPYLETHHLIPLAEGGEDSIQNVCAVCPNCHRRLHYGEDKAALTYKVNNKIKD